MIDRNLLLEQLHNRIVVVTFTKSDGSERRMRATLLTEYLPEKPPIDPSSPVKPVRVAPPNQIRVWDVDANGWRSFNLETVLNMEDDSGEQLLLG